MVKDRKLLSIEMGRASDEYKELPQTGRVVVPDNIRSAHNVGSAFRTCDSFKIDKLWLCGICAVPPSAEIHKSALGAGWSRVPWEHSNSTMDVEPLAFRGLHDRWCGADRQFCQSGEILAGIRRGERNML